MSLTGTREKQKAAAKEIGLGYTRKRALSPIDSESMVLQNEHPATVMHRDDASKSSKSVSEKKQRSSSRASATTKLSQLESHVSSVDRIIPSLKENAETSKSITASNYPRAELKEPHSLRVSMSSICMGTPTCVCVSLLEFWVVFLLFALLNNSLSRIKIASEDNQNTISS